MPPCCLDAPGELVAVAAQVGAGQDVVHPRPGGELGTSAAGQAHIGQDRVVSIECPCDQESTQGPVGHGGGRDQLGEVVAEGREGEDVEVDRDRGGRVGEGKLRMLASL